MKKTLLMLLNECTEGDQPLASCFAPKAFTVVSFQSAAAALDYLVQSKEAPHAILLHGTLPIAAQALFLAEMGRRLPDIYGSVPILLLSAWGKPENSRAPAGGSSSENLIH